MAGINLLDESTLGALYEDFASTGDLPDLAEMLKNFLHRGSAQVERVADAVTAGDVVLIRETAHKLKGSCRTLGAARAASVAAMIEEAGEAGDVLIARRELIGLRDTFCDTRVAFAALVERLPRPFDFSAAAAA